MDLETFVRLFTGFLLIGANAFFVAVEFALTRLRGLELSEEEIDETGLRPAWDLTERLEIHLTGCQLGISSTSVLLGVVAEPAITELIEPLVALVGMEGGSVRAVSVVVAVVLLNLAHKIWGEQAPTYLGVERPREVARRLAPVLSWWSRIMSPVIHLGDGAAKATLRLFGVEITRSWLTEETEAGDGEAPRGRAELKERMAELLKGDVVSEDRRGEVLRALDIGEMPTREIMIPSEEIVWLSLADDLETHVRVLGEHGYVRYPVLKEGRGRSRSRAGGEDPSGEDGEDAGAGGSAVTRGGEVPREAGEGPRDGFRARDVAGILYVPFLFRILGDDGQGEMEDLLVPPFFAPAGMVVSRLIDALQEERQEIALLTEGEGDRGSVVGMVTISDAFEVIAGDVEDPLDRG